MCQTVTRLACRVFVARRRLFRFSTRWVDLGIGARPRTINFHPQPRDSTIYDRRYGLPSGPYGFTNPFARRWMLEVLRGSLAWV